MAKGRATAKPSFLGLCIDVRFLIYDCIFEDIEVGLTQRVSDKIIPLQLDPQPHDDIASLCRTCSQVQSEIDKWQLSKSQSAVRWTRDYGLFIPEKTTFHLMLSCNSSDVPVNSLLPRRAAIVTHKRRVFERLCQSPYRDQVRKVEIVVLGAYMCMYIMDITKDLAKLSNVKQVEIVWGGGEEYLAVWRQDITRHIDSKAGLTFTTERSLGQDGGFIRFTNYDDKREYGISEAFEVIRVFSGRN